MEKHKDKQKYFRWIDKNIIELEERRESTKLLNKISSTNDAIQFNQPRKQHFWIYEDKENNIFNLSTRRNFKPHSILRKFLSEDKEEEEFIKNKTKRTKKNLNKSDIRRKLKV